ncbi:hypothetical protein V5O48_013772, partial [Marasmius crinis-equi]
MAPTTTVKPPISTSTTQASGSRNPVGFGSSAPRSSGSNPTSRPSSTASSVAHTGPNQPTRTQLPLTQAQENLPAPASTSPDTNSPGSNDTVVNDTRRRSSSYNSLFDQPNTSSSSPIATPEGMLAEMNRAAVRKGKNPMHSRPLTAVSNNDHDSDQDNASNVPENISDVETRSLHSIRTVTSSFARNESLVRAYHATLRRCYILQTMRESDLMQYSTTPVENQRIHVDDQNMIYHERNPLIRQPARPIEDDEVAPLRMIYPEPFSEKDPIHGRRAPRVRHLSPPSTDDEMPDPPYVQELRESQTRHFSARGRGGFRNRGSQRAAVPLIRSNASAGPSGVPQDTPSDADSEPDLSGNHGNRKPGGGGGDPPDNDPPGDPSDDPSDAEPHNSEDEYNRQQRRNRTVGNSTPPVAQPKPGVFGHTRYSSVDPTFNEKEIFEYDPTPKTEEEVLRAAFRTFEKLIEKQLYGPGSSAPNNAQKTVIQNIPRPGFYYGDQDFLIFDDWIRDLVRWLCVANLCGEEVRWSRKRNCYVLTAVDMFRKNTMVSFLRADARDWFIDAIEGAFEEDSDEPVTFMQVVSGLYRRFIHESSLSLVVERYNNVTYSPGKGVKGLFSELKKYTKSMPSPPDLYSFKQKLILLLPEPMESKMRDIHGITAERSSINEIMQAALACERSYKAGKYYQHARDEMKRAKRRKSRSRSRDRKKKEKNDKKRALSRSQSPKRLQ